MIQWTLAISNNFLCPLDISIDSSLIFSLYLEPPYLELLFISNKNLGPMQIFLSLSRTFQPLNASLVYSINACQIKRIILKGKIAQEGRGAKEGREAQEGRGAK